MRSRSSVGVLAVFGLAVAAPLLVAACGDPASDAAATSGHITIEDAWIRPTPPVSNVGAFYLTVRNDGVVADRVVGATASRCAEIEIHRTETTDGVASMSEAEPGELTVDAGASLRFEPTGLHVMCLGLDEPVEAGELLSVTMEFERVGPVTIEAVAENG